MSIKKDFLEEVKEKKKKNLMGIAIDMEFYTRYLKENDEDKAREKLDKAQKKMDEEQKKLVKDKNGRVIADNRDLKVVNETIAEIKVEEARINQIAEVKQNQMSHQLDYKNVLNFYNLVNDLPSELDKKLDEIEKL